MKRLLAVALVLSITSWTHAQQARRVPQEILDRIVDDDPNPLPKYMTPAERLMPKRGLAPEDLLRLAPPTGQVYTPSEYDPNEGMLIRWGSYNAILTEMTVAVTTGDPDAVVYILVTGASQQSSATSTLTAAGAEMDQVDFITYTSNTVWIRDYGPRFIFEDADRAIVDHEYNRPRPLDDAFPGFLGTLWSEPVYDMPLEHGGGNFHLFSNGDAFMSTLVLSENPSLSEQDVIDMFDDYLNVNLTIYEGFPTNVDSTRHIDMWMQPLGDYKIIIGEYPGTSSYPPVQITEAAVADLTARGYTVYRTPGWNSGPGGYNGTHYTYTNSVILNDVVLIPLYGGSYTTEDAQALAVFQTALPGKDIVQINCSGIIGAAGALHCIMMHVPEYLGPIPRVEVRAPNGGETWAFGQVHDITWSAIDDVGVTAIDIYYSTDGGATYPHEIALGEANDGAFAWTVPETASSQCRVKVIAHDADLNSGEDVSDADFSIVAFIPEPVYSYTLDTDPGWSTEGQWAFGVPTGGGSYNGDPTSGYTGSNVYGYNLDGDYTSSMPEYFLTTGAIDCTDMSNVELRFWRWLGVEAAVFDDARVQVSNDAANWTTVWEHTGTAIADTSWTQMIFDISATADNQPTVYVRWGMGPTDGGTNYPGWNIDDVEIWADVPPAVLGDMDGDGDVDLNDFATFAVCYAGAAVTVPPPSCDPADFGDADFDDDNDVDLGDFATFATNFTG